MSSFQHHIIGTGRWGTWLARRMVEVGLPLKSVYNRSIPSAAALADELKVNHKRNLHYPANSSIWLCLPDDQIKPTLERLNRLGVLPKAIVHASGTQPLPQELCMTGVCWPMQSINRSHKPDWANMNVFVQASHSAFAKTLSDWIINLGASPQLVKADRTRQKLHLSAVITQNFGNLLWQMAEQILVDEGLNPQILLPLAEAHLKSLQSASAHHIQTGPAIRGDQETMRLHRALLDQHPHLLHLYDSLSEAIQALTPQP